jgi:catechol 2,3-dioxygenase-like lactoylglutathione lyase family enzyme
MLSSSKLVAFAATTNALEARRFYEGVLGLRLVADEPFALVFDANG